MKNGIIIYKKDEASVDYVNWVIKAFAEENLNLKLVYLEDFLKKGINEKIDFVINKTRNVSISYMFELNNIRVFNNSLVTELSANKLKAYYHAKNNGLKTSDILISKNDSFFVRKEVSGHGGDNVFLTKDGFLENETNLCQKYLENTVGDIRFYVVGNQIINACIRKNSENFLHNFKKGAKVELYNVDDYEKTQVNKFLKGIYCDFVGIDFLLLKSGELIFNEIEDVVGSRMLSELGVNNTTEKFASHLKTEINI